MSFISGSGFRIAGYVVRRWVAPSGKYSTLVLDVTVDGRSKKLELRGFSDMAPDVGFLTVGQAVTVTGSVDMEKLTAKDKTPVKVDGYEVWKPALTIRKITVEASSVAPGDDPLARAPGASTTRATGAQAGSAPATHNSKDPTADW